jgi:hypothetical protein
MLSLDASVLSATFTHQASRPSYIDWQRNLFEKCPTSFESFETTYIHDKCHRKLLPPSFIAHVGPDLTIPWIALTILMAVSIWGTSQNGKVASNHR